MLMDDKGIVQDYRILSIDPGSTKLGIAIIDVHPTEFTSTVIHATTVDAPTLLRYYEQCAATHGERVARILAMENAVFKMLRAWEPEMVVSESPFMGRFPQAFAALTECLSSIRRAMQEYRPGRALHEIDPSSVKNAVGVSGKSSDKELMREALPKLADLSFTDEVSLDELDEHAIDAIAVGYARVKQVFPKEEGKAK